MRGKYFHEPIRKEIFSTCFSLEILKIFFPHSCKWSVQTWWEELRVQSWSLGSCWARRPSMPCRAHRPGHTHLASIYAVTHEGTSLIWWCVVQFHQWTEWTSSLAMQDLHRIWLQCGADSASQFLHMFLGSSNAQKTSLPLALRPREWFCCWFSQTCNRTLSLEMLFHVGCG